MQTTELVNFIIEILEDNKAEDIINLDVHELTSITDWMIICSATSIRHAQALGEYIVTGVKKQGVQPIGVEGKTHSEWLLIDLGDIVVHIMLPEIRKFYSLEKLWNVTLKAREDAD
jgi:ribosome-associated protein